MTAISGDDSDVAQFVGALASDPAASQAGFALLFFSQALTSAQDLAGAMKAGLPTLHYAACSTAGEITPMGLKDGQIMCLLFPASSFVAASAMLQGISTSGVDAISSAVSGLKRELAEAGPPVGGKVFALCLIDGLSYAEEAVTSAIHWQLDDIPLIGGSAGDDLKFKSTTLIANGEVATDAAVLVLFATTVPFEVFKTDNFLPTENKLVVTASDPGHRIVHEFNARNAAEEYASAVGLLPQDLSTLSFASHPTLVRVGGEHFCRSIQKKNKDGSMSYFCAVDDGIVLSIARAVDMLEATDAALQAVDEQLGGTDVILGFDCVLRRLDAVNRQVVRGLSELYRKNNVVGFGTYGEQYQSMHLNQTFTGIAFGKGQPAATG